MSKNANFTGQPVFSQILKLVDRNSVAKQVSIHSSDRYYKKFTTYNHLVSMLYAIYHKCNSIREVVTGMQVCCNRIKHLGIDYSPRRSTFAEANSKRPVEVFEGIYQDLYKQYARHLPDSRLRKNIASRLYIVDSSTIKLFSDILKNAGRKTVDGKRKGGIKVHTMIKADEDVPCLIKLTAAAKHDTAFVQGLKLPKGSIIVFDKAYLDYKQYKIWNDEDVLWVTRIRKNAIYEEISDNEINDYQKKKGVKSDQNVILGHTSHKDVVRVESRLITYYDEEKDQDFYFITNSKTLKPHTITQIYKRRWQIELLFKRLKQNYPLRYFFGESVNAIKLQIWCVLIADLLIKVIQTSLKKRWSFSNLSSMIRIHLMTYISLFDFLNNPEKSLINILPNQNKGPTLFE